MSRIRQESFAIRLRGSAANATDEGPRLWNCRVLIVTANTGFALTSNNLESARVIASLSVRRTQQGSLQ